MPTGAKRKPRLSLPALSERNHLLPMVALFFLAGCLSIFHLKVGPWLWLVFALGIGLGAVLHRLGLRRGIAIALCAFSLGALHAGAVFDCPLPAEGSYEITATVSGGMELRTDNRIAFALADVALDGHPVPGKAYCSLHYEDAPPTLFDGASIRFTGRVYHPDGASGAVHTDFRLWMRQNGLAFGIAAHQGVEVENTPETAAVCDPFHRIREWLETVYTRVMGENSRIAMALLLGERSGLSDAEYSAFQALGIAHVMSVSGLHVTLLGGLVLRMLSRIRLRKGFSLLVLLLFLALYCAITGFSAAANRAAVMLLLSVLSRLWQRKPDKLVLLAAAMLAVLIIQPLHAHSAGFVLSFSAMLGILLYAGPLERRLDLLWPPMNLRGRRRTRLRVLLSRLQRGAKGTLALSITAQLGVLLPTLFYFHQLPLYGVLINLFIVPLVSAVLVPLYALVLPLPFLGGLASLLTDGLLGLVHLLSALPHAVMRVASPPAAACIALGLALVMLSRRMPGSFRRRLLAAALVSTVCLGTVWIQQPAEVRYIQLAAGRADSALLMDGKATLLIDTGVDAYEAIDYLLHENRDIDALFLTHLHLDHAGGVEAIVQSGIQIRQIYLPLGARQQAIDPAMAEMLGRMQAHGIPVAELASGDELRYNKTGIKVLWPRRETVRPHQDANQYPLVLHIDLGGYALLQTSDLLGAYERYAAAPADVLKVAHHGSSTSTGDAFLSFVDPAFSLLSTASGSTALPHADTLKRLDSHGVTVLRTDECGDITLSVENGTLSIIPYRGRQRP